MKQLTKATMYYLLHLLTKAAEAKNDTLLAEYFGITKDAARAIESLRFAAGIGESVVAEALGVKPDEYMKFVQSGQGLSITAAGIKALAKTLKMTVEDLAAKMVSDGDGDAAADGAAADASAAGGGQADAPGGASDSAKSDKQPVDKNDKTIKSAQIKIVDGGGSSGGSHITKSADEDKEHRTQLVKMHLAGLRTSLDVRKDAIVGTDFAPGGTYVPEQSGQIIDVMVDQSSILQKITVDKLVSKKQDIPIYDITGRNAKRLTTGWAPNDNNRSKGTTDFVRYDCNKVNLEFLIDNETIALHQGNMPGLENFIYDKFVTKFKNEIVDLSINGTSDSADAEELVWLELAKGWLQLADDNAPASHKVGLTAGMSIEECFAALVDAQVTNDERFYSSEMVYICGHKDWRTYVKDLNARADGLPSIIGSMDALRNYDGNKIDSADFFTTKNILFTKWSNLRLGIVAGPNDGIYVERHGIPGGVLFRFTIWMDPNVTNYKALCVGKPA